MGKLRNIKALFSQLLFVTLAFVMMVVSSNLYVRNMLQDRLRKEAEELLIRTRKQIEYELIEPQTTLLILANTIRSMIIRGESAETVFRHIRNIHDAMDNRMVGFELEGFFGYFESYGGIFFHTMDWAEDEDYDPTSRQWFITANQAGARIAVTPIYRSVRTNQYVITYVYRMFDDEGQPLAVLCVHMPLDHINNEIMNMQLTEGGFGFLLNEELIIITHPNQEFIGRPANEATDGLAMIMNELEAGNDVFHRELHNYLGQRSFSYTMRFENNWVLVLMTPIAEYYQDMRNMTLIISVLGAFFTIALIIILIRIDNARIKADEQNRQKSILLTEMEEVNKANKKAQLMLMEIEQRDNLLNSINMAAVVLLSTENEENMMTAIFEGMDILCRAVDVDRVQIWRNEKYDDAIESTLHFVHICERLSEYAREKAPVPIGLHFPYSSMPEWENKFIKGQCINGPLHGLSIKEQELLAPFDIQSIVIIPLYLQDKFWGFFSLDDCRNERIFSDEEIRILRSGGLLLANAFLRNDMTGNIRSSAVRLEAALKEAQEANAAKSKFLATMSHEIRTPMNVILGLTENYLENDELPMDMRNGYEKIYNAGDLLLKIINDILDLSKIEADKLELDPVRYEILSLINDAAHMNVVRFQHKPIKFILEVDENIPSELLGDELRIKQILNNLLNNAFKYTDSGEVKLSFAVEHSM